MGTGVTANFKCCTRVQGAYVSKRFLKAFNLISRILFCLACDIFSLFVKSFNLVKQRGFCLGKNGEHLLQMQSFRKCSIAKGNK